jgi:hypothetical protein
MKIDVPDGMKDLPPEFTQKRKEQTRLAPAKFHSLVHYLLVGRSLAGLHRQSAPAP